MQAVERARRLGDRGPMRQIQRGQDVRVKDARTSAPLALRFTCVSNVAGPGTGLSALSASLEEAATLAPAGSARIVEKHHFGRPRPWSSAHRLLVAAMMFLITATTARGDEAGRGRDRTAGHGSALTGRSWLTLEMQRGAAGRRLAVAEGSRRGARVRSRRRRGSLRRTMHPRGRLHPLASWP